MTRVLLTWIGLATLAPVVHAAEVPSFTNDIVPIFTRFGCNQGACHGKGVGQNGFRLSLRGYAPDLDHAGLTREFAARRISFADPESSTLLRKACGEAPHEGGKLLSKGDRAYSTLLAWIRAGAPGPVKNAPVLTSLQVTPARIQARPGVVQPLRVMARFTDGTSRDVTWLCRFDSNDAGMAAVSAAGEVRVLRAGETAVRVSFQTEVAVVLVTAPHERPIDATRLATRNNFIDEHVLRKLGELRIEPSDLCSDSEFIRRAFLDTLGVLPTPTEVRSFLADTRADKRDRLVDQLLQRPEFNDHWSVFLGDLLQNRKERDHDVRGVKGVRAFHAWIHRQVSQNRPWDAIARDVLLASGSTSTNPAVGYYVVTVGEHGDPAKSEVVDSVAQAFLGTRIGCARCHNHPLERYTQDDFYHFAGFFSRVKLDRQEPKKGPTTLRLLGTKDNEKQVLTQKVGVQQPRTNEFLPPRHLDRTPLPVIDPKSDPREPLARWITDPRNEAFSGAMVNRIWRHYLGVGLVEPVDDLRASNPPTNPELWKALQTEFVRSRFDLRHLMRVILTSRTYQLSAATRPSNATDTRFYSHYYARRLPAETLFDAIASATEVADRFAGYPMGTRAGQLPDPGLQSYFLSLFGRSERVTACACERSGEVTMPQLLHLQNSEALAQKIRDGNGRLARLLRDHKDNEAVIDELFLATLSRLPSPSQRAAVHRALGDGTGRDEVFRDLFWALINSKDFAFNH
ncbi:MAG: DUF1553 domain-containing protein [Gemmataceae bacterium]